MARRKFFTVGRVIAFVSSVVVAFFAWGLCALHVTGPANPVAANEAQAFAEIPIPASAHNIRIAGHSQWIEFEQFVRFEAPVADCLKTAAAVAPNQPLQPVDSFNLAMQGQPTRQGVYTHFTWFDLPQALNVVGARGGPSMAQVWVDQQRGVFYLHKTD